MKTYICILRGINVSGSNPIKMELLRIMFEKLNLHNVRTYIQSGNVIFQTKLINNIDKIISEQIALEFGFKVPVIVIEKNEFIEIFSSNPFIIDRKEDLTKLHVTFLSQKPDENLIEKLHQGNYGDDEFTIIGKSIYLYCPNGYGKTKLTNTFFESKLKITATTRNWNTITQLANMTDLNSK